MPVRVTQVMHQEARGAQAEALTEGAVQGPRSEVVGIVAAGPMATVQKASVMLQQRTGVLVSSAGEAVEGAGASAARLAA